MVPYRIKSRITKEVWVVLDRFFVDDEVEPPYEKFLIAQSADANDKSQPFALIPFKKLLEDFDYWGLS